MPVTIWDALDILIVAYLLYLLYKLLRGSIAFNIFVGVVTLYVVWWLVRALNMDLLSALLNQFVNVGFIIIIIIFQPEVRRFLLLLGNTTLRQRSQFLSRFLDSSPNRGNERVRSIEAIKAAVLRMSRYRVGALLVMTRPLDLEAFQDSGVILEAKISQPLIESIFNKESPLHDGAVVISSNRIHAASCVLPVSDNPSLPKNAGLRHRAGVGVTEASDAAVFIVSEENGKISFAYKGRLESGIQKERLYQLLEQHYPD